MLPQAKPLKNVNNKKYKSHVVTSTVLNKVFCFFSWLQKRCPFHFNTTFLLFDTVNFRKDTAKLSKLTIHPWHYPD